MAEDLTEAERRAVASYLRHRPGRLDDVMAYGAYLLPSVLFAGYGLWRKDFAAVLVAYAALFIVVFLYLTWTRESSHLLRSALEKYEGRVGALKSDREKI